MIGKSCDFSDFFFCDVFSIQIGKKYVVRKKIHSHAHNYIESWNSIVYHVCQSVRPSIGWSVGLFVFSHYLRLELLPNCPYPSPIEAGVRLNDRIRGPKKYTPSTPLEDVLVKIKSVLERFLKKNHFSLLILEAVVGLLKFRPFHFGWL